MLAKSKNMCYNHKAVAILSNQRQNTVLFLKNAPPIRRDIEAVITGLTRNQFVGNHTRVRIPLSPPTRLGPRTWSRKAGMFCGFLFFIGRNRMFHLIKGTHIVDHTRLEEEFTATDNGFLANVSAEHIAPVFEKFLQLFRDDEPLFLFIEVPSNISDERIKRQAADGIPGEIEVFHRDVYYLDGYFKEQMLLFLHSGVGELLINDGLVHFGFGSLESHDEIGKYKYNIMQIFCSPKTDSFFSVFSSIGIPYREKITTAWDIISPDNPGENSIYRFNGMTVYDLLEQMKELGIYKAETREEP